MRALSRTVGLTWQLPSGDGEDVVPLLLDKDVAAAGGEREESAVKHPVVRACPQVAGAAPHLGLAPQQRLQLGPVLTGQEVRLTVGQPESLCPDPLVAGEALLYHGALVILSALRHQALSQHPPHPSLRHPVLVEGTFKLLTRENFTKSCK